MGKPVLKVKGYTAEEIKKLITGNQSYIVGLRLYIVYQVALGQSSRELAKIHQVSFKQITNWVHRFEKEGLEGLKDKKGRGRKASLSGEKLNKIRYLILNDSPLNHGFNSRKWTDPLLTQWIKQEYGISYQKAQIYNLLKRIGIRFQKSHGLVGDNQKV